MTTPPQKTTPTAPAAPVVPAESWPEQNRRRCELNDKKYAGGLTAEEQAEYERLQAVAREVISALLPPPLLTPAERAYIDGKLNRR